MNAWPVSLSEFFTLAADHVWQSTLFAGLAALVALALRHYSASLRYWIWLAASLKFMVPFAALIVLGGITSWRSIEVVPYQEAPLLLETVGQPFSRDAISVASPASRDTTASWSDRLPLVAISLWAGGTLLFLLRGLRDWERMRRLVCRGEPLTAGREVALLRAMEGEHASAPRRTLPIIASATSLEPGVFGIVRPVLLWPRAIAEHLTDDQMAAILAHELTHLRRHDNLTALIHLVVQAVFWFYPPVWWIGARLIHERERACDEAVIQRGSEREIYAESILKTCQFFLESPLPCVAGVTGSDLKKRIEQIMTHDTTPAVAAWKRALLTVGGVLAFITPVAVGALNPPPQLRELPAPSSLPAFDVISVRPNVTAGRGGRGGGTMQPTRFAAQNVTLKTMIRRAYSTPGVGPGTAIDLHEQLVIGGPEWLDTDKFDVSATTAQPTEQAQMRLMAQRMLADRFKLRAHWEKREIPVYVLTRARADGALGRGMKLASDAECDALKRDGPPRIPPAPVVASPPPPCGAIQVGS